MHNPFVQRATCQLSLIVDFVLGLTYVPDREEASITETHSQTQTSAQVQDIVTVDVRDEEVRSS